MERLNWLERNAFFAIVESRPRTLREWQHFGFQVDSDAIYADIPVQHTEDPDDESFPSSVHRWYGQIADRLFVVDYFTLYPNECRVQIPYSDSHEFAWQTLRDLHVLPSSIQTNLPVGISTDSNARKRTVFRRDIRGFDYPIYDGASDGDAESLVHFLSPNVSTIVYSLGEPEPDIDWVAEELVGGSRVHRARYNSRASALRTGCGMSKNSDNEFSVYSESPEFDARRYSIRHGVVINAR